MSTPEPPDGPAHRPSDPPAPEPPTARFSPPEGQPPRRSRWSPRRRWIVAGAVVLVLLVVGAALVGVARQRWGPGYWAERAGGPDRTAFGGGVDEDGLLLGAPGGPGTGPGGPGFGPGPGPGFGPDGPDGERGPRWRHGGPGRLANTAALTGSVVSVGDGNLVLAADGGGQLTVPTTDRTRVAGAGNGLSGLRPGQRVVVRVGGDKTAVAVFTPAARTAGTVTAVDGDRVTLVRPNGLTEVVDVAAVNPKPAVGDVVAARGAAADNGTVLKAEELRILPKAG